MQTELNTHQTELIKAFRFPLIVLVVFIHLLPFEGVAIETSWGGENIFHFFSEMISHNLGAIAVPSFFVISGFLFFYNLEDGCMSWKWVAGKWKSRIRTLLVPYLLWNVLAILAILLKTRISLLTGIGTDTVNEQLSAFQEGPLYWFWRGPADYPLWYLRDLMVAVLAAPILYYLFTWSRIAAWAVWGALWAFTVFKGGAYPFSAAAVYFTLGAFLGLSKTDFPAKCQKVKVLAYIIAFLLLMASTTMNGRPPHGPILQLFIPFGIIAFTNMVQAVIRNRKAKEWLIHLSPSVFFIYAIHNIYIINWVKGLFARISISGIWWRWTGYLLTPLIAITVCLLLFRLMNRFLPKTTGVLCGQRNAR